MANACGIASNEMTRSAPPARTTALVKHPPSARVRKSRSSADSSAISIEDIYQSAEKERLNYSAACRRQNLTQAQNQLKFFRTEPVSRPSTALDRPQQAPRDVPTPTSAWSEPPLSRPSSMVPHPELRYLVEAESDIEDDGDGDFDFDMFQHSPMTVTVSRDCCEIIGPQMCYECRKNRIRQASKQHSEMFFPTLEPSEENLTTASIVKRYLPGMSYPEIEDKIARGEIARPAHRKQNKTMEFSDEEDEVKPKVTNKKVTIATPDTKQKKGIKTKPSELYFSNIRHLNSKIISGTIDRNVGFSRAVELVTKKKPSNYTKTHFPTFVSPRKTTLSQETKYKTYFDPPLIAKEKQDVEPAFFAGSKGQYHLPQKLPDELVFLDKDGNEVKASDSKGFTAKMSASSETGVSNTRESLTEFKDTTDGDLTILAEDEELSNEEEEEEKDREEKDDSNEADNGAMVQSDVEESTSTNNSLDTVEEINTSDGS